MGDIKVNAGGSYEIHPDLGTYERTLVIHQGSSGVNRTFSWNEATKSQWATLWAAALTGGSTWNSAGQTLFGSTDWGAMNAEAREDVRVRVLGWV